MVLECTIIHINGQMVDFQKLSLCFETFKLLVCFLKGSGEMFEGVMADNCSENFPLVLMGAECGVASAHTWERTLSSPSQF
jgi:hypothetical protein